jgi:hypothetical protein
MSSSKFSDTGVTLPLLFFTYVLPYLLFFPIMMVNCKIHQPEVSNLVYYTCKSSSPKTQEVSEQLIYFGGGGEEKNFVIHTGHLAVKSKSAHTRDSKCKSTQNFGEETSWKGAMFRIYHQIVNLITVFILLRSP